MDKHLNKQLENESEDDILARIQEESLRYYNEVELPRRAAEERNENPEFNRPVETVGGDPLPHCSTNTDQKFPILNRLMSPNISSLQTPRNDVFYQGVSQGAEGFHMAAGETYIYPTNYPIRKYQKNIIHSALFHNTLVSLPTGLGKTFIAAVVMYNYYRWFPQGKIVFMAPTRPLVAQQIRACHDIMAIPIKDTVEMTGTMNPIERQQHWKSKRVFFLTPQVMVNDLRNGVCPASFFKCVVIDEAHRATKEYAYCHVIKELENAGAVFRILALSATPGSNIKAVMEVIQNLRISTLELRGEDSPDVTPYTHAKLIEPVSLGLSKTIIEWRDQFLLIFERYARNLREARYITCNLQNLTKFQLLKACDRLRKQPPRGISKAKIGFMISDFSICMTLAHGLELLQTYGLRAFSQYFTGCDDEETRKAAFTRLKQDADFHGFLGKLHSCISSPMDTFWSHPKHEHLVKILKEHFGKSEEENNTKVIIFCQYRVVVSEVYELLQNVHPLIKPVMFVGQGIGKDKSGLPQKRQIEVMKQFREGLSNVLIATCVAEEGLDIGSVDLLVLMEVQRSPVRLVQRLGRTGRHRQGRCVVLLTQGREVQKFHEAMATRSSFLSTIQNSKELANCLYNADPSMVPSNLMPKIQLVHVNVPQRITPGKYKKQSDIRQTLVPKLNNPEEAVESPLLSIEQVTYVKDELHTLQMSYNQLKYTTPEYLFKRLDDLSSQISVNNLPFLKNKPSKNEVKSSSEHILSKNRKKSGKEEKHGMDIRDCMALASGKAHLILNIPKEDRKVSQSLTQPFSKETHSPHIQNEETMSKSIVKEVSNELNCIFCKERVDLKLNKFPEFLVDHLPVFTLDQLSSVEIFVKDISKEIIFNINILSMFSNSIKYSSNDITTNITVLKQNLELPHVKKISPEDFQDVDSLFEIDIQTPQKTTASDILLKVKSPMLNRKTLDFDGVVEKVPNNKLPQQEPVVFDVNDLFEDELESLPKFVPACKSISSNIEPKISDLNDLLQQSQSNGCTKEKYFNLDDIFSEDSVDLPSPTLSNNTKTSTPISSKKYTISTDICSDLVTSTTKEIPVPGQMKECRSTTETSKECSSKTIFKKTNFHLEKNVFKIPLLNVEPSALIRSQNHCQNIENKNKILSPMSPVLSGKISNERSVNDPFNQSPESPILSGQIRNPNTLNFSYKPKIERRVLFNEDSSFKKYEDNYDSSLLCEPLDSSQTDDRSTENEKLFLSVSQLFDDESNEENKNGSLEQSSMYTITQMVNKISDVRKNTLSKDLTQGHMNSGKNNSAVDWGSFEEDYALANINLDNLCNETTRPSVNINSEDNRSTTNGQSTLIIDSSSFPMDVKVSSTPLANNNQCFSGSKSLDHSTSLNIIPVDDKNKKPTNKTIQNNEDSLITSRWSSCMKIPLHESKINTAPLSQKTSPTCSDSNSDVFQSPVLRKRILIPGKTGKVAKKLKKERLFLELEADVSGPPCSSDEENTSGLDDLDESFINDMTEHPNSSVDKTVFDIQAKYLQSIKSPLRRPGGYKIPTITSKMDINVFSQAVEEDDSYLNDSFCCDATEIPIDEDPSILEIAEQIIKKKSTKINKRKINLKSSSENEESFDKSRPLSSESRCEDGVKYSRKRLLSSSSSSCDETKKVNKLFKRRKKIHLLTSSDSDSSV